MSKWMLLYYLGWAAIDTAAFVGLIWITNPKHPERLNRFRQKFLQAG